MKKSTEEKLKHLCDWCTTIAVFMESKYNDPFFTKYMMGLFEFERAKDVFADKSITPSMRLRGYQEAQNDLHSMAKYNLNKEQYEELNTVLKEKYNVNIHDISDKKKAKRILKRGVIKNDKEFRLLNEVVDELTQTEDTTPLVEQYNELLLNYEKSKM